MKVTRIALLGALLTCAATAHAVTYQVGAGRTHTQLTSVANLLNPGDVVEVDGNATYNRVTLTRSGTQGQPITIRGTAQGTQRPVIDAAAQNSGLQVDASHYVFEDLVVRNASTRCVYLHGHNLTLRRVQVHTCLKYGILGSDADSGDMLLTEVEVFNQGNQVAPSQFDHPIYIATDHLLYPNAVLRIEKSWIHDNWSGNSIKSRARQVKIFYNWIEAVQFQNHTIEAIGPDPGGAPGLCPIPDGTNDAVLCNGEIIGNVLIARGQNANMMRLGGDGTGNSYGRYHVVNNTFIANSNFSGTSAAMIRAFGNIQSIELHNNIFWLEQGDSTGIRIVRDAEAAWVGGTRRVTGTKNLVTGSAATYASGIPAAQIAGLTQTIFTTTAGVFENANLFSPSTTDFRLLQGSPARLAGNAGSTSTAGYQIPNPTNLPTLQPPNMRPNLGSMIATTRPPPTDNNGTVVPNAIGIGALEYPFVAAPPPSGPLAANPNTLDFGGQSMNTTSPAISTTLTNTSGAPITVTGVTASSGYAVASNTCGTVAATATCAIGVTFTPPVAGVTGPVPGTLTVTYAGGPTGLTLTGTAERSLVTHYYRAILRRAPDSGGKAFWENEAARVSGLGANVNETWYALAQTFYFSGEYAAFNRNNAGYVTDLYTTFFNRAPDSGGLNFWVGQLDQGMPREVALASFLFSGEFGAFTQAIFGNTAVRAEIDAVTDFYRGLLARLPDGGGFNFWIGRFRTAQCQGQAAIVAEVEAISSAFALSGEYAARGRSHSQYVGDLYNAFLRRGGDLGGVQYWINQIAGGFRTREQVRIEFKNSAEFQGRVNAIVNHGVHDLGAGPRVIVAVATPGVTGEVVATPG